VDPKHERQPEGQGGIPTVDDLLASQIDYYRAHAPKYDDWWRRTGNHDLGEAYRLRWESEISRLDAALAACAPFGDVLEFAGGTGNWTAKLVPVSESITVVDASPEAVAIARDKVRDPKVTWVIADIFRHEPDHPYDTVFFSFWLSHVPPERFIEFWALVGRCLSPNGRVFFIDNAHPSLSGDIPEHGKLWSASTASSLAGIDSRTDLVTGISTRLAADGSTYDLVKVWRTSEELQTQLSALGWNIEAATTETAFIYGYGSKPRIL
jgi:demethylmenaquinone methyltransferase/2-methoxy-6-polyprenyl-1,4-benzoquinol methylase